MNDETKNLIMGITAVMSGFLPLFPASGKGGFLLFSAGFLILFLMSFLFKKVKNFKEYAVIYAVSAVFVASYPFILALACIFFAPFSGYVFIGLILAVFLIIDIRIFLFHKTVKKSTLTVILFLLIFSVAIWGTHTALFGDVALIMLFASIVFSFVCTVAVVFLGKVLRKLMKKDKSADAGLKTVLFGMTVFVTCMFLLTVSISGLTALVSDTDAQTTGDAVSPDEKGKVGNKMPDLFQAIEKNDTDAIKALLKDNINVPDDNGRTPLMYAAAKGNEDTVRMLITGGADVNADVNGVTAVQMAIMFNRPENAQILADAGAVIQPLTDMPLWFSAWMNPDRPWNDFRIFGFFRKNKVPFFKTLPGFYRVILNDWRKDLLEKII